MRSLPKTQNIRSSKEPPFPRFLCGGTKRPKDMKTNLTCSRVREKFSDYRWVPLEPDFIDYPNSQILMIGAAQGDLGKAATAEPDGKRADEEQPGEELEKLEHENEERIEALQGQCSLLRYIYILQVMLTGILDRRCNNLRGPGVRCEEIPSGTIYLE